jgi:hypothetical protein
MGFGSYDESEQDSHEVDADFDDENLDAGGSGDDGDISFDNGASNDELIDRLQEIKD